ncbi:hypothetical protein [Verrucosispora sp. NA02020]|uniref:hypothetical protein n=1 Tax=Verrucosispora sp. NA02020 TaxID=2742132 RepID=UPI00158FA9A6|nr:hypothetical protein [Verrucosispora sp. NA02020]QKW12199.1 hypothetical protein HUT12_04905 [Verrucosispora sp. NA02020]
MLPHFAVVGMIALHLHLVGQPTTTPDTPAGVGDLVATARSVDLVCVRCILRGLAPLVPARP